MVDGHPLHTAPTPADDRLSAEGKDTHFIHTIMQQSAVSTHTTVRVCVFTLQLCRERLLVLLVLERRRLGPLELPVHLVGHHAAVDDAEHHGEQQQRLEDPPLSPGAHAVAHV